MNIDTLWQEAQLLFSHFEWYSLLLIAGTMLLMIPINALYKLIMKKDCLQRLRKTVSALSVYLVAMGVIALFTWTVVKEPITFTYLLATCLPCGFLAQVLWATVKFVKDYGVAPILSAIANSKAFSNGLKNLGVDAKIVGVIVKEVDDTKIATLEEYAKSELQIATKLRTQLNGFIETSNMEEAIKLCLGKIKDGIKEKKSRTTV